MGLTCPDKIGETDSNTSTLPAVLVYAHGFVILDPLAATDLLEDAANLRAPVRRDQDVDGSADRFDRNVAEQPLGGPVPGGDGAVERFGDDGVVGGFDDRAEKALALGVVAALGSRLPAQFFEQPGQLTLQGDIVDQSTASTKLAAQSP